MADPWDWHDEGFKLDAESPLEITRCLWDEIPHSEEDSRSLFSTPLADIVSQDPPLYSLRSQDPEISCDRYCQTGFHGGSPRIKRRRLLFSEADPVYEIGESQLESDSVVDSFTSCPVDPLMQGCSSDVQQSLDANSLSSDAFWYRPCDDVSAVYGVTPEAGSHKWMTKSLEDLERTDADENMKIALPVWSGGQSSHEDVVQGPATPLPGRSTLYGSSSVEPGKHPSPPSTPFPKFSSPVAYPFTLLKPSETEGDITLKDINQRILMPPLRPVSHLQTAEDGCWPGSPMDSGLGFSGKSIVARTKIHTEGNGTITIMRTRG